MNRKKWIDDSRGLAMICIVISHCGIDNCLSPLFAYFFVPIFFFISGYLYKLESQTAEKLKNRIIYRLGIPYVLFTVIHYFVYFVVKHDVSYLFEMIVRIPIGQGLWFLSAMISLDVIVFLLTKIQINSKFNVLLPYFAVMFSFVLLNLVTVGEGMLWKVDITCCCIGYYYAGFLFHRYEERFSFGRLSSMLLLIIYGGVSYVMFKHGIHQNVSTNLYTEPVVNYLMSLMGCFIVCIFCKNYSLGKVVNYIGRNTILLYGSNLFLLLFIKKTVEFILPKSLLFEYGNIYMLFVVGLAIFLALLLSIPINRYIPFVVGSKKQPNTNLF